MPGTERGSLKRFTPGAVEAQAKLGERLYQLNDCTFLLCVLD